MDPTHLVTSCFDRTLNNTLWASAMGLVLALLWRWLPGWSRYTLGLLVVCRLVLPVMPASSWSVASWWPAPAASIPIRQEAPSSSPPTATATIPAAFPSVSKPPEPFGSSSHFAASRPSWLFRFIGLLPWFWLAGAIGFGTRLCLRQAVFDRWWRTHRRPAPADWHAALAGCRPHLRFRRPVQLWQVDGLTSPLACGLLRPCILLPSCLTDVLTPAEQCHILRHELAHHRYLDLFWNVLFATAGSLHWFNPLVPSGLRWLIGEREIQRDADAVRAAPPDQSPAYGSTLLKLVHLLPRRAAPAPACSPLLGIHHLKQRLTMIAHHHHSPHPLTRIAFAAFVVTITAVTFTNAKEAGTPPAAEATPPAVTEQEMEVADAVQSRKQLVRFKILNIKIPRFVFKDASFEEAANYAMAEATKYDLDQDPATRGFSFLVKGASPNRITCDLQNITVNYAIQQICAVGEYEFRIGNDAVLSFVHKDAEDHTLMARIYRMPFRVAEGCGWHPDRTEDFLKRLSFHTGITFPAGSNATWDVANQRLRLKATIQELEEMENWLSTRYNTKMIPLAFFLTAKGLTLTNQPDAEILTETKFTALLDEAIKIDPGTSVRLWAGSEMLGEKLYRVLDQIRAAGLKNVDFQVHDSHEY